MPWPTEEELADSRGTSMQRIRSSFFRKTKANGADDADNNDEDSNSDNESRGDADDDQAMAGKATDDDSGVVAMAVAKPKRRTCDDLSESEQIFIATMAETFMGDAWIGGDRILPTEFAKDCSGWHQKPSKASQHMGCSVTVLNMLFWVFRY